MSGGSQEQDLETRLQEAARVAVAREERSESPRGEWRDRLWFPAGDERQPCCADIQPTESNRQALESHCRTQGHIAHLLQVPLPELRRAVKRLRAQAEPAAQVFLSATFPSASSGGRAAALYEFSRDVHGDALEELRGEAKRMAALLPRLIAAAESDAGLLQLFDEATERLERLKLTLEYCRRVEATYDAARSVQEMVEYLREQKKQSA